MGTALDTLARRLQPFGFYFFLVPLLLVFSLVPFFAFQSLEYTSDGLHIYSSIRNTLKGHGFFFEGPTIEYFLGTHTFLSLVLLFPLFKIFDSPLVLAYLAPACHLFGTWYFYKTLSHLDQERKATSFISALSILYFFFPSAFAMMGTYYLFLPDLLLEPLILLTFYSFIQERWYLTSLFGIIILFLKEEYIPLIPLLTCFFSYCLHIKSSNHNRKFWVRLFGSAGIITFIGAVLSVFLLKYYRNMNSFGFGLRRMGLGINPPLKEVFDSFWFLIKPVFFILAYAVFIKMKGYRQALAWVLIFILYRVTLDILAYQKIPTYFWGNTLLTPTLFLALGYFLVPSFQNLSVRNQRLLCSVVFGTLVLCIPEIRHTGTFGLVAKSLRTLGPWNVSHAQELNEIRTHMEPPKGYEYFIAPEYTFGPFMDRSHVSLSYVMSDADLLDVSRRNPIFQNSRYVILPKGSLTPSFSRLAEARKITRDNFKLIWETSRYQLYGK